jgi:hypothetical protein
VSGASLGAWCKAKTYTKNVWVLGGAGVLRKAHQGLHMLGEGWVPRVCQPSRPAQPAQFKPSPSLGFSPFLLPWQIDTRTQEGMHVGLHAATSTCEGSGREVEVAEWGGGRCAGWWQHRHPEGCQPDA